MNKVGRLTDEEYISACKLTPFICIDFITCTNENTDKNTDKNTEDNKYVLGYRINSPAKNSYFVPGGRVYKGETINSAMTRIMDTEFGCQLSDVVFHGIYEHYYTNDNSFNISDVDTHIIVLAFRAKIPDNMKDHINLKEQHSSIIWLTPDEILQHKNVHLYTKYYFVDNPGNKISM